MSTFPRFSHLPLELQDMIWEHALPGPRVVEYQQSCALATSSPLESKPSSPHDILTPFAPALFSACRRSRHWTLKHYSAIPSPTSTLSSPPTIGYLDFTRDTLLLSRVPEEISADETESGIDRAAALRMDQHLSSALSNHHQTWTKLQFLAISVPVFLVTLWSGRGGLAREQSSPVLNALYELPALRGIAVVSTGAKEIEPAAKPSLPEEGEAVTEPTTVRPRGLMRADWDQRAVWRFLTANESKAGWAKLFRENLVDNFGLGKEDEDEEGAMESWEEVRRRVWGTDCGPWVVHVGLETEGTRAEMRTEEVRAEREESRAKEVKARRMSAGMRRSARLQSRRRDATAVACA